MTRRAAYRSVGGVPVFGAVGGSVGSGGGSEFSGGGGPGCSGGGSGMLVAGGGVVVAPGVAGGGSGVALPGTGVVAGGGGGVATPAVFPPPPPVVDARPDGTGVYGIAPRSCVSVTRSRVGVGDGLPDGVATAVCVSATVAWDSAVAEGVAEPVTLAFELTCGAEAVGTAVSAAPPFDAPPQYANAPAPSAQPTSTITERFMP